MPQEESLVLEATFIFVGTVQKLNAATMDAVPVTTNTAVVRVDEVLKAPETFSGQKDRDITVQLIEGQEVEPKEGQQAVFYTNGWLYGESIAVVEVGRQEYKGDITSLAEQIGETMQRSADQELLGRIDSADAVVAGRVSNIRPTDYERDQHVGASEHDPQWWEALIAVTVALKGRIGQDPLVVLFPTSIDVMWYRAPKFHAGQEGIWILYLQELEGLDREAYTALDPLDYQPMDQLDRIRRFISP